MQKRFLFSYALAWVFVAGFMPGVACAADAAMENAYITKLRLAAEHGNSEAQNDLGTAYAIGSGVNKNTAEALKWWHKAADQGSAKAQANIGNMYFQGNGIPKDSTEAVKWWQKAAENHNPDAQDQLGFAYLLGDGVKKNFTLAYMWFNIAASEGDKHAVNDRNSVAKSMKAVQIAEAQRLQTEWLQQHPKAP